VLVGELADSETGHRVDGAGDVDGDGYDDLVVGAWRYSDISNPRGRAYLVSGPSAAGTVSLADATAVVTGTDSGDRLAIGLAGAGDVNGDGFDDLLVGASGDDVGGTGLGAAYLLLGPVEGSLSGEDVDATLACTSVAKCGTEVAGAGDVDGDGLDDVLVGTPNDRAFLVLGGL